MVTINEIRKRIVSALQLGQDTSDLERQLKQKRQEEATRLEVSELAAIAQKRHAWQMKALAIREKAQRQGAAIDAFLAQRDRIMPLLRAVVEQVEILNGMQPACFSEYNNYSAYDLTRDLPQGFLLNDFNMPLLEHDKEYAVELSEAILLHLRRAYDALAGAKKAPIKPLPGQPVKDGLLDDGPEMQEVIEESRCTICQHPELAAIDQDLKADVPLRTIEEKYPGTSRSSLSRHKQHLE
jgi:hypothetical protein